MHKRGRVAPTTTIIRPGRKCEPGELAAGAALDQSICAGKCVLCGAAWESVSRTKLYCDGCKKVAAKAAAKRSNARLAKKRKTTA